VFPHDIVRTALEADLRWRDPDGYAAMHYAVRPHLIGRVREAAAPDVLDATRAFLFSYRRSPAVTGYFDWWRGDDVYTDRYQDGDRPQPAGRHRRAGGVRRLAAADRRRQAGGRGRPHRAPVGLGAQPGLRGPRPGGHLGLLRFMIYRAPHRRPPRSAS
jgi:hypothetical protein